MNKLLFLVLLAFLASLTVAAQLTCTICTPNNCSPELLGDPRVDPLANIIQSALLLTGLPESIARGGISTTQANYTFIWNQHVYFAVVQLDRGTYNIVELMQLPLGTSSRQALYDIHSLYGVIDSRLRALCFPSIGVSDVYISRIVPIKGGYHATYKAQNGTTYQLDLSVDFTGNTVAVTCPACQKSIDSVLKSNGCTSEGTMGWVPILKVAEGGMPNLFTIQTSSYQLSSVLGGYTSVAVNSEEVEKVIFFLSQKVGQIVNTFTVSEALRQLVNGYNYKIIFSIPNSAVKYTIVVFHNINANQYWISSVQMQNVPRSYQFSKPLTQSQWSVLSYAGAIYKAAIAFLPANQVTDLTLNSIYPDFPYFQFIFANPAYQSISIVILYDVILGKATLINNISKPRSKPSNNQQSANPKGTTEPSQSIDLRISKKDIQKTASLTEQSLTKIESIPVKTVATSSSVWSSDSEFQLIGEELRRQKYLLEYVDDLNKRDSRCTRSSLSGIFWRKDDHNSLKYVFVFADGSIKEVKGSCDYIQFKAKKVGIPQQKGKIDNCLAYDVDNNCKKCAFKYYLNGQRCLPVQTECSDFNYQVSKCEDCYTGYYLDIKSVCKRANFLCQTSRSDGSCSSCFKNYHPTSSGSCAYNAAGLISGSIEQQKNPLCASFNGVSCLNCVDGCYLNSDRLCKMPDPNCQDYDRVNQVCRTCMVGYWLNGGRVCVRKDNY